MLDGGTLFVPKCMSIIFTTEARKMIGALEDNIGTRRDALLIRSTLRDIQDYLDYWLCWREIEPAFRLASVE